MMRIAIGIHGQGKVFGVFNYYDSISEGFIRVKHNGSYVKVPIFKNMFIKGHTVPLMAMFQNLEVFHSYYRSVPESEFEIHYKDGLELQPDGKITEDVRKEMLKRNRELIDRKSKNKLAERISEVDQKIKEEERKLRAEREKEAISETEAFFEERSEAVSYESGW